LITKRADTDLSASLQPLVDEHEAAALLHLKVATLRRWRWAGKPPGFVKIGSSVRYERSELANLISVARRRSTSDRA